MNLHPNARPWNSRVTIGFVVLALMSLPWAGTAQAACGTTYTVQSGDTLMAIANLCGLTLASLEQANPQIADPSLIFPGEQISIVGGGIIPITGEQAALVISPTDGQPGTSVELAGSAFPASSPINVTISEAANSPVFFNTVSTDNSGSFSLTLTIPTTPPVSGTWVIWASSPMNGGPAASANFQVIMPPSAGTYTIQAGDTLSAIAGRFGTTVSALLSANPAITNANQVSPGMQIFIPGFTVEINGQTVYIVKGGDDLNQIAARAGVTLAALEQANQQITNPDLIFAGTHVTIPGGGLIPITGAQAQLTLAPTSGGPSTLITISGFDFPANAGLSVTAGPQGAAPTFSVAVTTDGNGGFATQLLIPPATPVGSVWLITAASPASGGPSATAEFQVTTASVNGQRVYIVKSGDTLGAIAVAQNMTLTVLEQANPQITSPDLIFPGDRVILP